MPEPVGEIEQEDYPDAEGREVLRQNTLAQRSGEIDAAYIRKHSETVLTE